MGSVLQRDHQLGEFIMAAQSHGVQSQLSSSVREGEGGSVEVQPAEGMIEGGDDDVALQNINGETLQIVEGNKDVTDPKSNFWVCSNLNLILNKYKKKKIKKKKQTYKSKNKNRRFLLRILKKLKRQTNVSD